MSAPVYEEQTLDNFPSSPEYIAALPLGRPERPAHTQGLRLTANDDVLIGSADNRTSLSFNVGACLRLHECV